MIEINKKQIIDNHCYTKLVYQRINKKLNANFSEEETEQLIKKVLEETELAKFEKIGKNFYISNSDHNIRVTVNSNTFRIITVDKIEK